MLVFLKKNLKRHLAKLFAGFGIFLVACLCLYPLMPVKADEEAAETPVVPKVAEPGKITGNTTAPGGTGTYEESEDARLEGGTGDELEKRYADTETARIRNSSSESSDGQGEIPIIGQAIYISLVLTGTIVDACAFLSAMLLDSVIAVDEGFTTAPVVKIGWGITRSMVNMIFALILLVIAFGTILNIDAYGLKNVLPKLIITIFLINFSLFFAGVIIDFSQVLTDFFLSGSQGALSDQLMTSLGITQQKEGLPGIVSAAWHTFTGVPVSLLIQKFFEVILDSIATFIFLALALIFLVRIIALWILLILAPLAWALGIMPAVSGSASGKWWNSFLKWAFIAPITSFFIYLALVISDQNAKLEVLKGFDTHKVSQFAGDFFTGLGVMQFLAVTGILVASLIVGKSMSGEMGKYAVDAVHTGRKILGNQVLKLSKTQINESDSDGVKTLKSMGKVLATPFGYGLRYDLVGAGIKKGMDRTAEPIERRAGSDVYDMTTGILSLGKIQTNEAGRSAQNEAVRRQKEMQTFSTNSEYYKKRVKEFKDAGDLDAGLRLLAAAENPEVLMKILMEIPEVKEKLGFSGSELSPEHLESALYTAYSLKGVPRSDINKNLADIGKTFDKNKYAGYTNMGSWDGNAGGPIMKFDGTQNIYTGWDSKGQEVKYNEGEINTIIGNIANFLGRPRKWRFYSNRRWGGSIKATFCL